MNEAVHLYVSLERDDRGYPPFEAEEIDGVPVGGDLYRVEGVPSFVHGIARGDVVKVVRVLGDERLWIREVVDASDHWTARVLPWDGSNLGGVASAFRALGCDAHSTPFGLVAVDIPGTVSASLVMQALQRGRDAGTWDFDLGVSPQQTRGVDES